MKKSFTMPILFFVITYFSYSCIPPHFAVTKRTPDHVAVTQGTPDKVTIVHYPKYRIDNIVNRIMVIGAGPDESLINTWLAGNIQHYSDIKVIEPGNLSSILGGKIIEYNIGLTKEESQLISQMFQVDHVLIFKETVSPHTDYIVGGRAAVGINVKMINTITGEVIYQSAHSFGITYPDPRPYGYAYRNPLEGATRSHLLGLCFELFLFDFTYALGSVNIGIFFNTQDLTISDVFPDSPAARAGIMIGDKILKVNDHPLTTPMGIYTYIIDTLKVKQGDTINLYILRDNKQYISAPVTFPTIPYAQIEKEKPQKVEKEFKYSY